MTGGVCGEGMGECCRAWCTCFGGRAFGGVVACGGRPAAMAAPWGRDVVGRRRRQCRSRYGMEDEWIDVAPGKEGQMTTVEKRNGNDGARGDDAKVEGAVGGNRDDAVEKGG